MAKPRAKSRRTPQQNPVARGGAKRLRPTVEALQNALAKLADADRSNDYLLDREKALCDAVNAESKAKVDAEKRAQDAEERAKAAENRHQDWLKAREADLATTARQLDSLRSDLAHFRVIVDPCDTHLEIQLRKAAEETRDAAKLVGCWIIDQAPTNPASDHKHGLRVTVRNHLDSAACQLRLAAAVLRQNDLT